MDCVLSDIKNSKLGTGRRIQGVVAYGGGPLWSRRSALGYSRPTNDDEEEEEEELSISLNQMNGVRK